jgi:hypothetical protein
MSQQTARQRARRTAREFASKRRRELIEKEKRIAALAEEVMVAIEERDLAIAESEARAGEALRRLVAEENLAVTEALVWCGNVVPEREARRLRRVAETVDTTASNAS